MLELALQALIYSACLMIGVLFFLLLILIIIRVMDPTEPMSVESREESRAQAANRRRGRI